MAIAQIGWAVGVVRRWSVGPRVVIVGLAIQAGIVAIWVAAHTTGLPVGSDGVEAIGLKDGICTGLEVVAVIALATQLSRRRQRPNRSERIPRRRLTAALAAVTIVVIAGATVPAIAAPHAHSHRGGNVPELTEFDRALLEIHKDHEGYEAP